MDKIIKYLQCHKIKPSYPRIRILDYLMKHRTHPTVDEIYNHVAKEIPTLSKATVYNTLNLFITSRVVKLVLIEENLTRYDADTTNHGHFKCEKCGVIYDFINDMEDIEAKGLQGFKIKERDIYLRGICKKCLG